MRYSSPIPDPNNPSAPPDPGYNCYALDGLYAAADLWRLVDAVRGEQIRAIIRASAASTIDEGWWALDTDALAELIMLIDALLPALAPVIDERWRVRLGWVARVVEELPDHVITPLEDERPVVSLANAVYSVLSVQAYIRRALDAGRWLVEDSADADVECD